MSTTFLTKEQTEAATSQHPQIVVVAGPGSGKTRTLIERLIYLRALNFAVPSEIVVITFTNEAAGEIIRRLNTLNGDAEPNPNPTTLNYCGTLHGFILRLMKQHGAAIGFRGRIALLDETQQKTFRDQIVKDMKFKGSLKEVNAAIAEGPEGFMNASAADFDDAQLVAFEYYQRLMSASMLDFDSLLRFGAMLIEKLNAQGYHWPIRHLLWDEFQDSGPDDARIHAALNVPNKFTIGDPDQSIYGFRGGDPKYLLGLLADTSSQRIFLQENFRCDGQICETANRLIANNPGTHVGTLSRTGQPGNIFTWRAHTEQEEHRGLAEDLNAQANLNQCAVLVRTNALADSISKGLEGFGILVSRKEKSDKPADWQTARSLINLLANPDNDLLAYWWIVQQKDKRFADKVKMDALNAFTSINRHYLNLPNDIAIAGVPAAMAKAGIGAESIELISHAIALLPAGATMAELSFQLGDAELHRKEAGDGVTVTTMHASKGREWDCVYIPAFEAGVLPSESKNATIEEERRLLFVAITRARRKLSVSYSQMRKPQFGGWKPEPATPSRFMGEIRPRG